ncbi:RNA polymerase sigma factor [Parafilimonas sp.]|uniref:RNA polymerase sigma factor n=1 Tax=Parafilimonas sp. TaxID=1969739 RepID=UPI0039E43FFF
MKLNSLDDSLLLAGIKTGNQKAFDLLFNKYWEKCYSQAYKRLKNKEDAKDVVQEIFATIWLKRASFCAVNFEAYLHAAIRNNTLKILLKQQAHHSFFNIADTLRETSALPDSRIAVEEFMEAYANLLATLPPQRRAIFQMRFHEQLPTKEIALRLDIKRKTVQNQLGKAVHFLKLSLSKILVATVIMCIILKL